MSRPAEPTGPTSRGLLWCMIWPAEVAGVTKRIMVGPPEPDYYAIDAELAEAYSL